MDCGPPGSSVHGILQARIPVWVAIPFSRGSSQPSDQTQVSLIEGGFSTIWATRGAQEYRSGWPIPSPGELPDPGITQGPPALHADYLPAEPPGKPHLYYTYIHTSLIRVQLFVIPWTVAHHAPLSMEFSRQEYWSGLPFPSPECLSNPGIEPSSPALQVDSLLSEPPGMYIFTVIYFSVLQWQFYLYTLF